MLIQTPGSFVFAASLAARLGSEGWASWGVFVITGCLQGSLLVMAICFEIKARKDVDGLENDDQAVRFSLIVPRISLTNYSAVLASLDIFLVPD